MRRFLLIVLSLSVATQTLVASTKINPKLSKGKSRVRTVVLLAPTAQMTAVGLFKDDIKEKESEALAVAIGILMSDTLKKRGWTVIDAASTDSLPKDSQELKYLMDYLRASHQKLVGQFRPGDVVKGRYTMGDRVRALSAQMQSDVLVLVHGDGRRLTKVAKLAPWVEYGATTTAVSGVAMTAAGLGGAALGTVFHNMLFKYRVPLSISLVDSNTGEILFYSETVAKEENILKELNKIP
jgi:hypothetical protein